jgi:hypothetical protein
MDEKRKITELLDEENKKHSLLPPLIATAAILAISFPALFAIAEYASPETASKNSLILLALTTLAATAAFILVWMKTREPRGKTARRLDKAANAKNSLETSLELANVEHPLKNAQLAQTATIYEKVPIRRWSFIMILICVAITTFLLADIALVSIEFNLGLSFRKHAEFIRENIDKTKAAPKKKATDYFKLEIVSPKSETRAKPLDEIAWKGVAESNKGFEKLYLAISVNGLPKAKTKIDDFSPNIPGVAEISGTFCLDEINAEPFDLVSYHLEGRMDFNDEKNKLVLSVPQFIEVRPFKENATVLSMPGGGGGKYIRGVMDFIIKLLRAEIALNKAAYAIRASGLTYGDDTLRRQIALIETEQKNLGRDIDNFFKKNPPGKLPPNILDNLKKARRDMGKAAERLRNAVEEDKKEAEKQ